jgi:hypothetical protein
VLPAADEGILRLFEKRSKRQDSGRSRQCRRLRDQRREWFHIGLVDNAPISTRLSPTSRIRQALHCDPYVIR